MGDRHRVFIAHAEADAALAKHLRDLLSAQVGLASGEIFLSSDTSIRRDAEFPKAITRALRQAEAVAVLTTPASIRRAWLHFEAGGAHFFKPKKRLYVLLARGLTPECLPSSLSYRSATNISNQDRVRDLCAELRELLDVRHRPDPRNEHMIENLSRLAEGLGGWHLVQGALVAEQRNGSPFGLLQQIRSARKMVAVFGQNLYALAAGPKASDFEEDLFNFLNRGGEFRALIQDAQDAEGVAVWNHLHGGLYVNDLDRSTASFRAWLKRANAIGINQDGQRRLDVRTSKLVPVTFEFIDPLEDDGLMLCTPVPVPRGVEAAQRPVFAVSRRENARVIDYYWSQHEHQFQAGTLLEAAES